MLCCLAGMLKQAKIFQLFNHIDQSVFLGVFFGVSHRFMTFLINGNTSSATYGSKLLVSAMAERKLNVLVCHDFDNWM